MPNLRLAMQVRALNIIAMATKQSFHTATGPPPRAPQTSSRINLTADPCIVFTKALMSSTEDTLSLAQGIVHWAPPAAAIARATAMATDPAVSSYGPDEGSPALREALRKKLTVENGLKGYDVHITAGANQAFMNVVLALLDPGDKAVLFTPYYFNHHMALTMGCGVDSVLLGPCNAAFRPDLNWLELQLTQTRSPPKMVVLTNPCNPTGVLLTREELERAAAMTAAAGAWLIVDDTYEHFVYDGREHFCPQGPHILHLFSFSKAWGMMGWRQGYIAFPSAGSGDELATPNDSGSSNSLGMQLLKVQDTVPICAPQLSQQVSLAALEEGREWVLERVANLAGSRDALLDALSPLGKEKQAVSEGAIYLWTRLPDGCDDDVAVVTWLVQKHRVCLIPGSSCGSPGHVRVAFANLEYEKCLEAAARLKTGLQELLERGMAGVNADLQTRL